MSPRDPNWMDWEELPLNRSVYDQWLFEEAARMHSVPADTLAGESTDDGAGTAAGRRSDDPSE